MAAERDAAMRMAHIVVENPGIADRTEIREPDCLGNSSRANLHRLAVRRLLAVPADGAHRERIIRRGRQPRRLIAVIKLPLFSYARRAGFQSPRKAAGVNSSASASVS